jgi:hypothetical protein
MPIVVTVAFDLFDMAMLRLTIAPSQYDLPVGQEHGRTLPISGRYVMLACPIS